MKQRKHQRILNTSSIFPAKKLRLMPTAIASDRRTELRIKM